MIKDPKEPFKRERKTGSHALISDYNYRVVAITVAWCMCVYVCVLITQSRSTLVTPWTVAH